MSARDKGQRRRRRSEFLLAQEPGVAHSHVGIIPGPGPDTSTFFLVRLGSTPLFLLGKGWDQFGGNRAQQENLLLPSDGQLTGLKSMDLSQGHSGQCLGTFLVDTLRGCASIWHVEPENAATCPTQHRRAAHRREGHVFPRPHVTGSRSAK